MTQTTETAQTDTATDALLAAMIAQVERENAEHIEEEVAGPVTPFPTIV
ncbi:hypothetical protein [Methylobacterium mesophilicum]